jgi:hypothetical protein
MSKLRPGIVAAAIVSSFVLVSLGTGKFGLTPVAFFSGPQFTATFTETGLTGQSWSATLNATTLTTSSSSLAFNGLPPNTYPFTVTAPPGYTASPDSGSIVISTANVAQGITFNLVTTTAISSSLNPSAVGNSVTYTATVSPTPTGGTVSFTDNLAPIPSCQSLPLAGATASCPDSYASPGAHNVIAIYSGTSGFDGSTSPGLSEIVSKRACATLAGCNLSKTDLSGANLRGADLSTANLNKTVLSGANLSGANLNGANLNGADLTNVDLSGATTVGTNFNKVTWSNTTCPDGTNSDNNAGTCIGHL